MTRVRDLVVALTLAQVGWSGAADDAHANTVTLSPGDNIQIAVDGSPAGTTFVLKPGIYRDQGVTLDKAGDKFMGQPDAIMNGAIEITDWTKVRINGVEYYAASGGTPLAAPSGQKLANDCEPGYYDCVSLQNLYIDDTTEYQHVTSLGAVESGSWYYDFDGNDGGKQNYIYITDDPTGHTVELGGTKYAFTGTASDITIQGLAIEHYAAPLQFGAISPEGDNWQIMDNQITFNHGYGIKDIAGKDIYVYNNTINYNGEAGFGAANTPIGGKWDHNIVEHNNTDHVEPGFEAGGSKFCNQSTADDPTVISNNIVEYNYGNGLWTDSGGQYVTYTGNTSAYNAGGGIRYEISEHGTITDNTVYGNTGVVGDNPQIIYIGSDYGTISGNTVTDYGKGAIHVQNIDCGSRIVCTAYEVVDTKVTDNTVLLGTETSAVGLQDYRSPLQPEIFDKSSGNVFDNNTYEITESPSKWTVKSWAWGENDGSSNPVDWNSWRNDGQDSKGALEDAASSVNGACGAANGVGAIGAPTTNLCNTGTASAIAGTGPWTWSCAGSNGGTSAACDAPLKVNGACGTTADMCSAGTAASESNNGTTTTWSCTGSNGGTTASCSVADAVNGACGTTADMCSKGTAASESNNGTTTTWSCTGSNGGTTASCSVADAVNGACGTTADTCSKGTAASESNNGTTTTWSCTGSNGGTTASCSVADAVNGACGTTADTCSKGTAASESNNGTTTTWSCTGSNGGTTASCSVADAVNGACGTTADTCSKGTAASESNNGTTTTWSCTGSNGGTTASCSVADAVNGACGAANGTTVSSAPATGLCNVGTASAVSGSGPWSWSCVGGNGGTNASCEASKAKSALYVNCNLGGGGTGTASSPFGSLQQAQQAMESSTIKTAIVSGTCNLGGNWSLSTADNGETWEAACGQVTTVTGDPIIVNQTSKLTFYGFNFTNMGSDGGEIVVNNANNFTARWNSFSNCVHSCIAGAASAGTANDAVIDSNTFNGMLGDAEGTPMGAFTLQGDNIDFSHNLVEKSLGSGMRLVTTTGDISNSQIVGNLFENVDEDKTDTGAIYLRDTSATATGVLVQDNAVIGDGPVGNKTKCIYLDDGTSNVTITGNLCAASSTASPGAYNVFIHAGVNNVVTGNTFEVVNGAHVVGYQTRSNTSTVLTNMSGNVFKNNTIYTPDSWPSPFFWINGGPPTPLAVSGNHYYSPSGAKITNWGYTDASPTFGTIPSDISLSDPSSMLTNQGPSLNSVCPTGY